MPDEMTPDCKANTTPDMSGELILSKRDEMKRIHKELTEERERLYKGLDEVKKSIRRNEIHGQVAENLIGVYEQQLEIMDGDSGVDLVDIPDDLRKDKVGSYNTMPGGIMPWERR